MVGRSPRVLGKGWNWCKNLIYIERLRSGKYKRKTVRVETGVKGRSNVRVVDRGKSVKINLGRMTRNEFDRFYISEYVSPFRSLTSVESRREEDGGVKHLILCFLFFKCTEQASMVL